MIIKANLLNDATFLGLTLGIIFAFIRSYKNNSDKNERKKLRRVKGFLKKKLYDVFLDHRFSGIISFLFLCASPFYFGNKSENPSYFGLYSQRMMLINTIYFILMVSSAILFIYLIKNKYHRNKNYNE